MKKYILMDLSFGAHLQVVLIFFYYKEANSVEFAKLQPWAIKKISVFLILLHDVVKLHIVGGKNNFSWASHKGHLCNLCPFLLCYLIAHFIEFAKLHPLATKMATTFTFFCTTW